MKAMPVPKPKKAKKAPKQEGWAHPKPHTIEAPEKLKEMHQRIRRCTICGGTDRLEVHHIIHRSLGGGDEPENLIMLCKACHDKAHANVFPIEMLRLYKQGILGYR